MNDAIFFFFYNLSGKSYLLDKVIVFFAVYFPLLLLSAVCIFLLYQSGICKNNNFTLAGARRLLWKGIIIIGPAFIAYLIATGLKELIHLERSFVQFSELSPLFDPNQQYSFPSTHAAIFSALAFSIFFFHKKAGYVFMLFALLIGLARIIAGVHFPIDILGGFVLGAGVSCLVAYFLKKYSPTLN